MECAVPIKDDSRQRCLKAALCHCKTMCSEMSLQPRAWHHAVSTRWRIGWCMPALRQRAMGVAPGGAQMSEAGKRDGILLSRLGAFPLRIPKVAGSLRYRPLRIPRVAGSLRYRPLRIPPKV